ncbi:hypothetical protein SISSUDRAFT_976648 [Sistotremastrum suecicum HHB10207 ss-3]|uniref:ARID domain-containing protein n=1 Tax=Sistotremastrum suecicum HHB10207 ss-3 TaxID=1314776 RepID=A0A166J5H8_9AGAM|nr:hypothetical protein SISSUDRAFT_976648 [Sistotremastrum suecicum HHB10207 ss-3]
MHTSRQRQTFYSGLAQIMQAHGRPLPPTITGIPLPYDEATSPWKTLEPSSELGGVKFAGRDVDLFKLWSLVASAGTSSKFEREKGWASLLPHFDLPAEIPSPQGHGVISSAARLADFYRHLLFPFEEFYIRTQQQAQMARSQGMPAQGGPQQPPVLYRSSSSMGQPPLRQPINPYLPQNTHGASPSLLNMQSLPDQQPGQMLPGPAGQEDLDHGAKRKMFDSVDHDGKRARRRTGQLFPCSHAFFEVDTSQTPTCISDDPIGVNAVASSGRIGNLRKKIEYVPIARSVDSYGGRELEMIEAELAKMNARRALRNIDEWGLIDIDGLTMSLRSRLPTELSFSLASVAILSTMRGAQANSGFPLGHAEDLLSELLDLLQEKAFDSTPDDEEVSLDRIWTFHELSEALIEEGSRPLASIFSPDNARESWHVPMQRPGDLVLAVINVLRNFTLTTENQQHIAKLPEVLDLVLRVASLAPISDTVSPNKPRALSPVLTLGDIAMVRRDALHILLNLAGTVDLSAHNPATISRVFGLLSSFLIDPSEAIGPMTHAMSLARPYPQSFPIPALADVALECFSKIAQPDANRAVFAKQIPSEQLWILFESMVHRLPVTEVDFKIAGNEQWFSYIEKIIMSLYCLAFIADPELKARIRDSRALGFHKVIMKMVKKYTVQTPREYREYFVVPARRAIEVLKLIDDGGDSFATPQISMPTVAFGMGYGEQNNSKEEFGTGLLGGYSEDLTWSVLLSPMLDDVMFAEMDSLLRIASVD